jgi:hypothetical protein
MAYALVDCIGHTFAGYSCRFYCNLLRIGGLFRYTCRRHAGLRSCRHTPYGFQKNSSRH